LHTNVRDNSLLVDMLSSAVFLPRVSGRAAKRALKRLRLLVAGRNWAALNSSGSQLIGVRYVQVGLEERENLTVTWNVSIAIRSLCVTLLAAILALVLVVALAEDADARKVRRKKGLGALVVRCDPLCDRLPLPDRFSCSPVAQPVIDNGYRCTPGAMAAVISDAGPVAGAVATNFDLNDVLSRVQGPNAPKPPPGPDVEGTATPDVFQCQWDGHTSSANLIAHFKCKFPQNQQTRVFKMDEIVATNRDEEVPGKATEFDIDLNADGSLNDVFLPPAGTAVPSAVPAGADAAGEGSAAWLFGLVLAAGGALVGSTVIARRRFLHDS
jgi:hypothetical protein